jgi:sirohydrochlorin ferrochelatase
MTGESVLLVGRTEGHDVFETHAARLRQRIDASVTVATYEDEPARELRDELADVSAETAYVVPMCAAHTYDTINEIPAALSSIRGTTQYCAPIGESPAVTDALADRAAKLSKPDPDTSLVLVGFGSSAKPYSRQTVEYHATRLREQTDYKAVVTCYLLQNPTVECVRYNVPTDRAVAVPVFVAPSEATEQRIPSQLELDRGGIQYADPLGEHQQVTEAIAAELAKQRSLAADSSKRNSLEAQPINQPVATDGDGIEQHSDDCRE